MEFKFYNRHTKQIKTDRLIYFSYFPDLNSVSGKRYQPPPSVLLCAASVNVYPQYSLRIHPTKQDHGQNETCH